MPGKIFDVAVHYWPHDENQLKNVSADLIVDKTLNALTKFNEGHALVFLPRQ